MQKLWISTKQVSYKLPLLPTSLGGQWDKSNVSGPALPHLKREQHNNQMGGTNQAFENLEGTLVPNSAFKRGKRPRAFTLFIPTHFPIFT